MLEKCKMRDFKVGDCLYFQWDGSKKLNGPFLVLGWAEEFGANAVTIHRERKENHKILVEIDLSQTGPQRDIGYMHLDNDEMSGLTFYKSDVILLQENA